MSSSLARLLGVNVKKMRLARGLTQAALAKTLRKTVATISNIENGRSTPSFASLEKLCEALQCNPVSLFENPAPEHEMITVVTLPQNRAEANLLQDWRKLNYKDRRMIQRLLHSLVAHIKKPLPPGTKK
ncbi:MAG: helix-turn-helix domain-containing protein [Dongiaceae bacterium]